MKTSHKIVLRILILILLIFLSRGNVFVAQAQQNVVGKVTGSIFDQQDAVIPGTEITIENQNFRKNAISDTDGTYTFELPPGIYTVATKQGTWNAAKRANFLVRASETTTINLSPTIRITSIALEITPKGTQDVYTYNDKLKYDEFFPFPNSPLNVVVEYGKKKRKGVITEYRNAKFTYNNQSVFADILRLDRKNLRVEAKGNLTVDQNGKREKHQNANLQISKFEM